MASDIRGTIIPGRGILEKVISSNRDTCGTAMKSSFPSKKGCTVSQFVVFCFRVARPGLSSLTMPGDFLFLIADVSETLPEPGGNIGLAMRRYVVGCRGQAICVRLFAVHRLQGLGYVLRIPVYRFSLVFFACLSEARRSDLAARL